MKKFAFLSIIFFTLLASAACAFQMNSGYYVGTGQPRSITGVGFQPDLVIIKADTTAGSAVFTTSDMGGGTAFMALNSANLSEIIKTLDTNGFSLTANANVNSANVRYTWTAFKKYAGSDFHVGSYTGDGTAPRTISGLSCSPKLVWIKNASTANYAVWSNATMSPDSYYFYTGNTPLANRITAFGANSFTLGSNNAEVNANGSTYYYVAFDEVAGKMKTSSYTGNGTDDTDITGLGFKPDFLWIKGADTTAARPGIFRNDQNYGDESHIFTALANAVNYVQSFILNGFQIGDADYVNENLKTYYYAAFGGVPAPPAPTGSFTMATGSYEGNGTSLSISGLGFMPDLVLIKSTGSDTQPIVFTTSQMAPNSTAYLATATANFANGISSLDNDGFSIGNAVQVNTNTVNYCWTAFGNSGSVDFKVGAYTGINRGDRLIESLGFQPDLIAIKRQGASVGCFRTSSMIGDLTAYFQNAVDVVGRIKTIESNGFQIGTSAEVNTATNTYFYFAFKTSSDKFKVASYEGDATDGRLITSEVGFLPELAWIKRDSNVNAVHRNANLPGDSTQYFTGAANAAGRIKSFVPLGFELGTQTEVNAAAPAMYRFAAWRSSGAANKLAYRVQPSSAAAGATLTPSIQIEVQDQYGNRLLGDNTTQVSISIGTNPGGGTLSGTLTKTVSSGIATFNDLSINKTGNGYTLNAASAGLTGAASGAFNITPAATDKLAYIVQPTSAQAGVIISPAIQVAIRDQYDNLVTTDNTTSITIGIETNPGGASLFGTKTKTVSTGEATFDDFYLNKKGEGYKLIATAGGLTSATSDAFSITGEMAPPKVLSTSPSNDQANVLITASLEVDFSQVMDQASAAAAFSLKAVRDNSGTVIDTAVTGGTTWDAQGRKMYFTPSELNKGYTYTATVAVTAQNTDLIAMLTPESFSFVTVYDHTRSNIIYSSDGRVRLTLGAATLPWDGNVVINRTPRTAPTRVDPVKITNAINKVLAEGDPFHYPLEPSITEFNYYDQNGTYVATRFAESAVIALFYDDANNDGIVDNTTPPIRETDLILYRLDENHGLWVRVPNSAVNTADNYVYAPVNTFSVFTIMATPALSTANVYAFPNPFKPSLGHTTVTFTNLPSTCNIKVFTLSGDTVTNIQENSGTGQYVWDVKNSSGELLQSGMYLYIVRSAGDSKTGKLVIIR